MCALFGNSIWLVAVVPKSSSALNFEGLFLYLQIAEIHSFNFNKSLFMNRSIRCFWYMIFMSVNSATEVVARKA